MKITYAGVELIDSKPGDLRWCLDFRDMEHGGFVLCPLYGRKSKAFQAASGTSNTAIISNLVYKNCESMVGLSLSVDSSQSLTAAEYIQRRAKEAVRAEETPCGAWSVTRLCSATHGTLNIPGLSLGDGPKGGLGEQDSAVIVRPLSTVNSLVRFAEEPQMFAIEFNDGCPILVYGSTSRESLLAAGQCPIPVLTRLKMPGHRIDPPCGRVHLQIMQFYVGQSPVADMETATTHLKHFAAAAKDVVAVLAFGFRKLFL
ncbi:unnamed protein product [Camellia sinensis]